MTYEDVKRIRENPTADSVDNAELAAMIDKAVEKQIAKKPRGGTYVGFCECGKSFLPTRITVLTAVRSAPGAKQRSAKNNEL